MLFAAPWAWLWEGSFAGNRIQVLWWLKLKLKKEKKKILLKLPSIFTHLNFLISGDIISSSVER